MLWLLLLFFTDLSVALGAEPVLACPDRAALGHPFLVRLTSDHAMEDLSITWMGKSLSPSVSVWNRRHVALAMLGTDVLTDKPGPRQLKISGRIRGKEIRIRHALTIVPKSYPRQDLTLPSKMVTPPESVLERIRREGKLTRAAKESLSAQREWHLPFCRPVPGTVTSAYGLRRFLNKTPKNPHRGLDFRAPAGTAVKAVAGGKVVLTGEHYYAGRSVYIDHGNGVVSLYFHLSRILVRTGDTVKRGQPIGRSGSTGRSTGPHLHLSVSVQGRLVDPLPLMTASSDQLLFDH